MRILSIFDFVHFFMVFCFWLLLGAFLKAGINEFEISIKFCVFLIPIMIFFKEKNFWVIIALFAYFKCKCEKNYTFSNILQKEKSYFFCQYLSFSVWFLLKFQKKYKIEAPYCRGLIGLAEVFIEKSFLLPRNHSPSLWSEVKRTIFAFNLSKSKRKRSFVLENVKNRSKTISLSPQLVKIKSKTNLARSIVRSKAKRTACS